MTLLDPNALDRLAARLARDVEERRIPGASVVIGHHDQVAFERQFGFTDAASGRRLPHDAVWRLYSMTKPIVSLAIMVLVERGALTLEQTVDAFIPAFGDLHRLSATGARVAPEARPTVQDLLRHTAGLGYGYLGSGPAHDALVADGFLSEDLPLADFVDRLAALPLQHEPGRLWHYSHATDVLGRILELCTGRDLQGALAELVLDPLAMTETGFRLDRRHADRVAQPFGQGVGTRAAGHPLFFDPCAARRLQSGGGGLVSTAHDYVRFLRLFLNRGSLDGRRVLSPALLRHMTSDHLGTAIGRASYYPQGPGYGFGLGVAVRLADGEAAFAGSAGDFFWSGVGGTYFWVDPSQDLFVLLLLQSGSAEQRRHYRSLLRNMVYGALRDG